MSLEASHPSTSPIQLVLFMDTNSMYYKDDWWIVKDYEDSREEGMWARVVTLAGSGQAHVTGKAQCAQCVQCVHVTGKAGTPIQPLPTPT